MLRSHVVPQLCAQQITNCYTSLQSWEEASAWLESFSEIKKANAQLALADGAEDNDK